MIDGKNCFSFRKNQSKLLPLLLLEFLFLEVFQFHQVVYSNKGVACFKLAASLCFET